MTHPNLRELVKEINKIPETVDEQLKEMYKNRDILSKKISDLRMEYPKATQLRKDQIKLEASILQRTIDKQSIEITKFIKLNNIA